MTNPKELKAWNIQVTACDSVPDGVAYLIPPIPTRPGEDPLAALLRHVENHPEQFGKIINTRTQGGHNEDPTRSFRE